MKISKAFMTIVLCFCMITAMIPIAVYAQEDSTSETTDHTIEAKTYPHLWHYRDGADVSEGEMTLYFVDGGDIPYVALTEYFTLLSNLIGETRDCEISFDVEVPETGGFTVTRPDNESLLFIDTDKDVLVFSNYDSFLTRPGSSALVSLMDLPDPVRATLDYDSLIISVMEASDSEQLELSEEQLDMLNQLANPTNQEDDFIVTTGNVQNRAGSTLRIDLSEYSIDLVSDGNECYLPMQTMNDLFINDFYIRYVFNGQMVIGDTFNMNEDALFNRSYEAEPCEMSEEFAQFNYNELRFLLDSFYGLKEEHRIKSFADYLAMDTNLLGYLLSTDPQTFDLSLQTLLLTYFDDGHSGFLQNSWRSGKSNMAALMLSVASKIGYSYTVRLSSEKSLKNARNTAFPDGVPGYEEVEDTAFISFDTFNVNREDYQEYYELEEPDNPQDTIELILYAHRQITRENSPIKNIVVDLSLNGGGNADAAVAVASWITGKATIAVRNPITGAETIMSYLADLNLNGITTGDTGDSVGNGGYNLYCLISPVSFSCGNLVPAIFQKSGRVTLIGRRSGGGSCTVLPATTASGSCFQMSGNKQISTFTNGSFYNIDQGIEPDIPLTKDESFYDRAGLVEMIHDLR